MISFQALLLLFIGFAAGLYSAVSSNAYAAIASLSLISYIILSNYLFEKRLSGMSVSSERSFSMDKVPVSTPVDCKLSLTTRAPLNLKAEDALPTLFTVQGDAVASGKSPLQLQYTISTGDRGLFDIGPTKLTATDSCGNFYSEKVLDNAGKLLVYPSLNEVKRYDMQMRRTNRKIKGIRRAVKHGAGTDFLSLRKYLPGDELRQIDWKATARMQKLMVRTFEAEKKQRVMLLLDTGGLMHSGGEVSMLDCGINTAVLLSHLSLSRGDMLGFASFSNNLEFYLKPSNNRQNFYRLLEALAKIRPENKTDFVASFRSLSPLMKKRSLVIIISALKGDSSEVVEAIRLLKAHKHAVVVIAPFEPWFEELSGDELVKVVAEGAEEKYWKDLHEVSNRVKRFGVRVVPVGPEDMMKEGIAKYVQAVNEGLATL